MITFRQKGDFSKTFAYLKKVQRGIDIKTLEKFGEEGVAALTAATPKDTGLTASSWKYGIQQSKESITVSFYNTNIQNGVPIAVILQYGHATKSGYWVEGIDYINPALKPIFEKMASKVWEEVKKV